MSTPVFTEPLVGYQPCFIGILTRSVTSLRTVSGGQFDWGGRLRKSNGGAQRFPQRGRKPREECKGRTAAARLRNAALLTLAALRSATVDGN